MTSVRPVHGPGGRAGAGSSRPVHYRRAEFSQPPDQTGGEPIRACEPPEACRDGRHRHPAGSAHIRLGNWIGCYEGDSLVVETDHLEAGYIRRNSALPGTKLELYARVVLDIG